MAKSQYWLVDDTGTYALANGTEERDAWLPRSHSVTEAPTGDAFVWVRHPDIEQPAKLPAQTLEGWAAMGWAPGLPPEPASPFNGAAVASAPSPSFASMEIPSESAVSGSTKKEGK